MTECRNHKVVVKGKKAAEDPMKVVERVQKKTGRKVELLTPLPPPKPEKKEEKTKPEEKKEVVSVHLSSESFRKGSVNIICSWASISDSVFIPCSSCR